MGLQICRCQVFAGKIIVLLGIDGSDNTKTTNVKVVPVSKPFDSSQLFVVVRPGTLGQVVPGFEVKVCDEDGNELGAGETGWLWVRGGARALGYWQQLEKTAWGFRGEWYVSGDLVTRDAEGWFTYGGRSDDMLKVSGKWLATREVEDCLEDHPAVQEAAVVGIVDADGLTKPHAFVVVGHTEETDLGATLQAWVKDRLEPYKYPREVVFLEDLPRTHLGKVDRGQLRKL